MNAAAILAASIEDIDAGRWTCNTLIDNELPLDENVKPIGCALGLVGINSGAAKIVAGELDGATVNYWEMTYPDECEAMGADPWSDEAWLAIEALAKTADLPEQFSQGDPSYRITTYNDGTYAVTNSSSDDTEDDAGELDAEQAKAWFSRALALLPAAVA